MPSVRLQIYKNIRSLLSEYNVLIYLIYLNKICITMYETFKIILKNIILSLIIKFMSIIKISIRLLSLFRNN